MPLGKFSASAVALAATTLAVATPTRIQLGPQGEILAWLVAGPFPNVGALQLKGTGFATDYLRPEAAVSPVEGLEIVRGPSETNADPKLIVRRKAGWQVGLGTVKAGIDLDRMINGSKPGIAYLYTELIAPRDLSARLLFGSDDGAKVWLNGELKFTKQLARGVKRDEDAIEIDLKKGTNRILFKIEQGDGGWGLLARVAGRDGERIPGLVQSLNILPGTGPDHTPLGWLRRAVGKAGAFDVAAAQDFEARSARARRWVQRFRADAANPARLERTLADTRKAVDAAGAGDASHLSKALADAAQSVEVDYTRARLPLLKRTQRGDALFRATVAKEDYVRVMPGGRYFVHADGRPFIPIGYNHNPDWTKFDEANPSREVYDPTLPDRYMAHLRERGVNVIRLMIETPPSGNLEEPVGLFSPEHVRWIDTIVLAARKHDIKLLITPWDTFWMNRRWETTPFNPENGGLVKERIDFITSKAVRVQQKRRIQYLIDRWGNTGTIFGWELLNEADLWWGASAAQLTDWVNDIATYARTYERQKWGRNHLLSVSFAEAMPKDGMATVAYRSPHLDYATTHLYIGAVKAPTEPIAPAGGTAEGVRYALGEIQDRRPYMDTENGPIDRWVDDAKLDEEVFLNMTWAHIASGAAGTGFRWPYRHPHHLTEGMLDHLKTVETFVADVDWFALAGDRKPWSLPANTYGFTTARAFLVWSPVAVKVTLPSISQTGAAGKLFNVRTGTWTTLQLTGATVDLPAEHALYVVASGP